jgi:predicted metal-dependent hydrolase
MSAHDPHGSVPITRRDIHFDQQAIPRHWFGGDVHRTRLFDAMSLMFPEGERFFIESVRHYRERIAGDQALDAEVRGFIGQEAMHSREHAAYNARLDLQNVGAAELEAEALSNLNLAREKASPAQRLAMTLCLEHFTAMLANEVLAQRDLFANADPEMARLWRWHALEETEHKAVAFDVFRRVFGEGWRPYVLRSWIMLSVSFYFTVHVWSFLIRLVRRDGHGGDWRGWLSLLGFMFGKPGPFRKVFPAWFAWFKPGFHPWQHDNRDLLEPLRSEYAA